jgi:hypothetical protein
MPPDWRIRQIVSRVNRRANGRTGEAPIVYLQPIAETLSLSQALARMRQIAQVSGTGTCRIHRARYLQMVREHRPPRRSNGLRQPGAGGSVWHFLSSSWLAASLW